MAVGTAALLGLSLTIGAGVVAGAAPRPSSSEVLHFFSKPQSGAFLTAAGKPFNPSKADPPRPGDQIESSDLDYVGNHLHHAATWTASDHELCIFDAQDTPVCHAEVADGGSMILAQVTLTHLSAATATFTYHVTGGTGVFQGVSGNIVVVNLTPEAESSNSDVTITLSRS